MNAKYPKKCRFFRVFFFIKMDLFKIQKKEEKTDEQ